ncbi:MAG: hypothetical protein IKQ97_11095 [Eubacterium sp.]|nr:hypothetical protein [Eubacterium sp.]
MPGGKRKEKRLKRRLMNRSPQKRYEWLLSLREGTNCILKPEDKYRIYRRLEDEFLDLSELEGEEAAGFTEQERCAEYAEEAGRLADEMEADLPEEAKTVSRTVMMSAGERQAEDRKQEGSAGIGRWIFLGILVLLIGVAVCYKIPATRTMIGDAQDFLGMESFAIKSYRVGGEKRDGWGKAVRLEQTMMAEAPVGQKVKFGKLDWIVLDHKDGQTLIIADQPIKDRKYHKTDGSAPEEGLNDESASYEYVPDVSAGVSWKECSLREWLNGKFLNEQLYPQEKEAIAVSKVAEYSEYGEPTGEETEDMVFIPSSADIEEYEDVLGSKINNLRLRDQGEGEGSTAFVSAEGNVITYGYPVDEEGCYIRPMMWIKSN